ncbi:MAG: hypothetical protein ABIW76_14570, partial [Fibrobacteria bacterium]
AKFTAMEAHYLALTDSTVRKIAGRYGARYLVSKSEYGFPRIFTGAYNIYEIAGKAAKETADSAAMDSTLEGSERGPVKVP